jgi:hypothetical protein
MKLNVLCYLLGTERKSVSLLANTDFILIFITVSIRQPNSTTTPSMYILPSGQSTDINTTV